MSEAGRILQSAYMQYAKLSTGARFNLASSGVANCSLADLGLAPGDLELHSDNPYGYVVLLERIAARFGVAADCVVTAGGTSFANHLAMAALVAPGDEVLVEDPTYELLMSTLGYLQARVVRFTRRPESAWRIDAAQIAALMTPRTRLVVLTNLHNPSSALTAPAVVAEVAAAAARVGALVLVDEVYLELMFRSGAAFTSFRADGNVVVTSSLTKAYGLSGLRCGWILAQAELAQRMRLLNDLYAVQAPHVTERMSVVAFDKLEEFLARANRMLDANRAAYREILGAHPRLEQRVFDQGTTVFPRLIGSDGDRFAKMLQERFETSVVPGRFFGRPEHIRIGLGGDIAATRAGLERIAEALE